MKIANTARLAVVAGACGAGLLLRLAYRLAEPLGLGLSPGESGILGMLWASPIAAVPLLVVARVFRRAPFSRWITALAIVTGGLGVSLAACDPESKFLPYPSIDTCLAPGFKVERFGALQTGMSPQQVTRVAGPPRFKRDAQWGYQVAGSPDTIWSYSADHCSPFGDYAWEAFEVGFRGGRVVSVSRTWRYD